MKKQLIGLLLLGSISSFAIDVVEYQSSQRNIDGTTTYFMPKFKEGFKSWVINSKSSLDGVCKAINNDSNYLKNSLEVPFNARSAKRAFLNEYGELSRFSSSQDHSRSIVSITCFQEEDFKTVIIYEDSKESKQVDGYTFFAPRLVRGNKKHLINTRSSLNGVCVALGFSKYLEGSMSTHFNARSDERVFMNQYGKFSKITVSANHSREIEKITCYNE